MQIEILDSVSATKRRTGRLSTTKGKGKPKKHPVPTSIEKALAVTKPKPRVMYSSPGRYVLKSKAGQFAVVRIKEQVKYVPSMKNKLFAMRDLESVSSNINDFIGTAPYLEDIEELQAEAISFEEEFLHTKGIEVEDFESDSAQARRGAGGNQAGSKMGRKTRAPNMLAPGWHIFHLPASGGKMKRYYAGPRISARRVSNIMNGDEVPEGQKKSPNETATKTRKAKVSGRKGDSPSMPNAEKPMTVNKIANSLRELMIDKDVQKAAPKNSSVRLSDYDRKKPTLTLTNDKKLTTASINKYTKALKDKTGRDWIVDQTSKTGKGVVFTPSQGKPTNAQAKQAKVATNSGPEGKALMKEAGVGITKLNRMVKEAEKDGDKKNIRLATKLRDAMASGDGAETKRALRSLDKNWGIEELEDELGVKGGKLRSMMENTKSPRVAQKGGKTKSSNVPVKDAVNKVTEGKSIESMRKSLERMQGKDPSKADPKIVEGVKKAIAKQDRKITTVRRKIHNLKFQLSQLEYGLEHSEDASPSEIKSAKKKIALRKSKLKEAQKELKEANNGRMPKFGDTKQSSPSKSEKKDEPTLSKADANKVKKIQKEINKISKQVEKAKDKYKRTGDGEDKRKISDLEMDINDLEMDLEELGVDPYKSKPAQDKAANKTKPKSGATKSSITPAVKKKIAQLEKEIAKNDRFIETAKDDLKSESDPDEAKEIRAEIKDAQSDTKDKQRMIKELKSGKLKASSFKKQDLNDVF